MSTPSLSLVTGNTPPTPPPSRPMSAEQIVKEFGTDPVSGQQLFSAKWVRQNVPKKMRLSHSKVMWYYADVVTFFDAKRKAG